ALSYCYHNSPSIPCVGSHESEARSGVTMAYPFDLVVCAGLFQPGLKAHLKAVRHALTLAPTCLIIFKNAGAARTPRHPFSVATRAGMLTQDLQAHERKRIKVVGLRNDYNAPRTLKTLQQLATSAGESASRIGALLLDDKFTHVPQEWVRIDPEPYVDEQPMRLRNALYGAPQPATALERYADLIPQHTLGALQRWITSDQFEQIGRA